MEVRKAMHTEIITASCGEDVRSVVQKMVTHHCGVIPVVDQDSCLIGVVTARDIMMPMFASEAEVFQEDVHAMNFEEMELEYPNVLALKVDDIMTRNPVSVPPDFQLLRAASIMGLKNLRRMPVTENGKLVGIVSVGDINRALFLGYTTVQVKQVVNQ